MTIKHLIIGYLALCIFAVFLSLIQEVSSVDVVKFILLAVGLFGMIKIPKLGVSIVIIICLVQALHLRYGEFNYHLFFGFEYAQWLSLSLKNGKELAIGFNVPAIVIGSVSLIRYKNLLKDLTP